MILFGSLLVSSLLRLRDLKIVNVDRVVLSTKAKGLDRGFLMEEILLEMSENYQMFLTRESN